MPAEKLPVGFTRRDSGSLRVQIRLKGHEPVVKNFPLLSRDPNDKRRQLADAKSWAEECRRLWADSCDLYERSLNRTPGGGNGRSRLYLGQ
jgi:hypothetical protein